MYLPPVRPSPESVRALGTGDLSTGSVLGESLAQGARSGILGALGEAEAVGLDQPLQVEGGQIVENPLDRTPLSESQWEKSPYWRPGLKYEPGMNTLRAQLLAAEQDKTSRASYVDQHWHGFGKGVVASLGQIAGTALDPTNYIPLLGQETLAARIGAIPSAMAINAAGAAMTVGAAQGIEMAAGNELQQAPDWEMAARNVGIAAMFGAGTGLAFGVLGHLAPRVRVTAAAKALDDVSRGESPDVGPILQRALQDAPPLARPEPLEIAPSPAGPVPEARDSVPGRASPVITDAGTPVDTRFMAVESRDLLPSHTPEGIPNPEYPSSMQLRDRSRAASQMQIGQIDEKFNPELVADSPGASQGAPIVGTDHPGLEGRPVVESGNGRTAVIQRRYARPVEGAAYKDWLMENASRFGLDTEELKAMEHPVLVRQRETPMSEQQRVAFAREANASPVAGFSSTEQALADAKAMNLDGMQATERAGLTARQNREWVDRFIKDAVPSSELNRFITPEGALSKDGARRLEAAVFAKAYGDPEMVKRMAEEADNGFVRISNGLLEAAPSMARLRGTDRDISAEIVGAVDYLRQLRGQGLSVAEAASQGSLLEQPSPVVQQIANILEDVSGSGKTAGSILKNYAKAALASDTRQATLLGGNASNGELLAKAVEETTGRQTELFDFATAVPRQKEVRVPQGEGELGIAPEVQQQVDARYRDLMSQEEVARQFQDLTQQAETEAQTLRDRAKQYMNAALCMARSWL